MFHSSSQYTIIVVVQSLSHVWLFVTPWTIAHQASLSFTISWSCSNSLPLNQWCCLTISSSATLLLLPSVFPQWVSSSGGQCIGTLALALVLPMNIHGWFLLRLSSLICLLSKGLSRVFSSTIIWKHQFFSAKASLWSALTSVNDYWKNHSCEYTWKIP